MSYTSWSVVFGEQPSAAKWNILGTNDASFNDGTGIGTDAIKSSSMFYGMLRNRQGNNSGDADWNAGGSTNVATDAKDVFIQAGAVTGASGTITFPTAFNFKPLVFVSPITASSQNVWARVGAITVSTATWQIFINNTTTGTSETVAWLAIGQ